MDTFGPFSSQYSKSVEISSSVIVPGYRNCTSSQSHTLYVPGPSSFLTVTSSIFLRRMTSVPILRGIPQFQEASISNVLSFLICSFLPCKDTLCAAFLIISFTWYFFENFSLLLCFIQPLYADSLQALHQGIYPSFSRSSAARRICLRIRRKILPLIIVVGPICDKAHHIHTAGPFLLPPPSFSSAPFPPQT